MTKRPLLHVSWLLVATLVLAIPLGGQPPLVAPSDPLSPEEQLKKFHLPPDFEIQLVAAEPAIQKPMNLAWDAKGRLWLTDTREYPFPAAPGTPPRDTVKILADFDEFGRAKTVKTFATGLNIPIGLLPQPDGAIVFSIPKIERFTDTNGDDRSDRREELLATFGSADTHGMTNAFTHGLDGWIYACHGFANTSTIRGRDGSQIKLNSGNVYRFRPDGTRVEQFTWGQVNPFGLTFNGWGELFSADCHTRPLYLLLRGGFYPSFGKPHDGLGFVPEICGHDHGSTAIAGVACYEADHFPPEYHGRIFIGNVVTNRINQDRLERRGGTVKAIELPDFLTCDDPWFRPVDLKLGPDGALYIADFYNRIIGHYEVPLTHPGRDRERGRVWRVVYTGTDGRWPAPHPPRRDWTTASREELFADLRHPNQVVRTLATHELVRRCGDVETRAAVGERWHAIPQPGGKSAALWYLERTGGLAGEHLRSALDSPDPILRATALRILAERDPSGGARDAAVVTRLYDPDGTVRRIALEALGRGTGLSEDLLERLLSLHAQIPPDDVLTHHVLRMTLRNRLRAKEAWRAVGESVWTTPALAQHVAEAALGLPTAESGEFLLAFMQKTKPNSDLETRSLEHASRYVPAPRLPQLVAWLTAAEGDAERKAARVLAHFRGLQARGQNLSTEARAMGVSLVTECLRGADGHRITVGCETAAQLSLHETAGLLAELTRDRARPENLRSAAATALMRADPKAAVPVLVEELTAPQASPGWQARLVEWLAQTNRPEARTALRTQLAVVPEKLQLAIATALAGSRAGAEELLAAIAEGKASPRLLQERAVEAKLQAANPPRLNERLATLRQGLVPVDQTIRQLMAQRMEQYRTATTDPAKGRELFKTHCAACHQIANEGAKVGPQLDGIGVRGVERLLEDILDPHRNVDQAFRATLLELSDGRLVTGLLQSEEGEVVIIADEKGQIQRLPKMQIEQKKTLTTSPMPANLAEQIPEAEFPHLLRFLLDQKMANPTPASK